MREDIRTRVDIRGEFCDETEPGEDFAEQENLHHNGYLQSIKAKCRKASVPSSSCFTDLSTQKIATFHRFQIKTVSTFATKLLVNIFSRMTPSLKKKILPLRPL